MIRERMEMMMMRKKREVKEVPWGYPNKDAI